jgi:hypothetical protein
MAIAFVLLPLAGVYRSEGEGKQYVNVVALEVILKLFWS